MAIVTRGRRAAVRNPLCGAAGRIHTPAFMRWLWLTLFLVGGVMGQGCGKTVYRSHEAQFCSTNQNDDPFYECSPSNDLVCINTYAEVIQSTSDAGGQQTLPIYLCRLACDPNDPKTRCPNGETCCPGPITGRNYGKMHACVPESRCDNPLIPDGGVTKQDARPVAQQPEAGADRVNDGPVDQNDGPGGGDEAGAGDAAAPVDAGDPDAAGG